MLDTNLLLLWLVTQVDPVLLLRFKRVQMFTEEDVEVLNRLLRTFSGFVTTPHVLAEVSNFLHRSPPQWRVALLQEFRRYVEEVAEVFVPAESVIDRREFNSLGLTDTVLLALSRESVVVTMDFQLADRIGKAGGTIVNFNHYRLQ